MDVMQAMQERRSIRKYQTRSIEQEKLDAIAQAFRLAPTARNEQKWKLYIVQNADVKAKIRAASPGEPLWLTDASAILVVTSDEQRVMTCGHRVDTVNLSIGMSFCVLEAWEQGLGTCWMAMFKEDGVREALGLPENISIAAISPLGYADEAPNARSRKPLEDVVEYI